MKRLQQHADELLNPQKTTNVTETELQERLANWDHLVAWCYASDKEPEPDREGPRTRSQSKQCDTGGAVKYNSVCSSSGVITQQMNSKTRTNTPRVKTNSTNRNTKKCNKKHKTSKAKQQREKQPHCVQYMRGLCGHDRCILDPPLSHDRRDWPDDWENDEFIKACQIALAKTKHERVYAKKDKSEAAYRYRAFKDIVRPRNVVDGIVYDILNDLLY